MKYLLFTSNLQLRQITQLARANAADGNLVANLVDRAFQTGISDISGETLLNAIVNSNRIFINALIAILDFGNVEDAS